MSDRKEWDLRTITEQLINGPGGLHSYEEHELVVWHNPDPYTVAGQWMIRCLVVPENREMLNAIVAEADRQKEQAGS